MSVKEFLEEYAKVRDESVPHPVVVGDLVVLPAFVDSIKNLWSEVRVLCRGDLYVITYVNREQVICYTAKDAVEAAEDC